VWTIAIRHSELGRGQSREQGILKFFVETREPLILFMVPKGKKENARGEDEQSAMPCLNLPSNGVRDHLDQPSMM
jgi:hypothetical protein